MSYLPAITLTKRERDELVRRKAAERADGKGADNPFVNEQIHFGDSVTSPVVPLANGASVPCDGKIYRDSRGELWFGLRLPIASRRHLQRLYHYIKAAEQKGKA